MIEFARPRDAAAGASHPSEREAARRAILESALNLRRTLRDLDLSPDARALLHNIQQSRLESARRIGIEHRRGIQ